MKVVINRCFGGFGLSHEALLWLAERGSPVVELNTFAEYYGADEFGMVEYCDYENWNGETDLPRTMMTVEEYHARRSGGSLSQVTVFQDRIVYYDDKLPGIEEYDEGRAAVRRHPDLVDCVEALGAAAFGPCAELVVIEIPDGTEYVISEYDGNEHIAEKHRTWP